MGTPGIQKVGRYGDQFKATAVALSHVPGVLVKDVAEALDIHPFMLSPAEATPGIPSFLGKNNTLCS